MRWGLNNIQGAVAPLDPSPEHSPAQRFRCIYTLFLTEGRYKASMDPLFNVNKVSLYQ